MKRRTLAHYLLFAALLAAAAAVRADDLSNALILVAKPELTDALYGSSILVVVPIGGDQHVGFIVNRPTDVTLGKIFPEDGPAQKIVDPVYLGGPVNPQMIFALVQRPESPGGRSLRLMPGLYAAIDAETVDGIIRSESDHARFVAGFVGWQPGELQAEIKNGAWYVLSADPALALRKPEGLWEELVRRSKLAEHAI
jgi:putative transcriptional regulator